MILVGSYLGTIILANVLVQVVGPVPVGFGFLAPAGVYCAGLAFTLRDLIQDRRGRLEVVLAIFAGTALSAVVLADSLALAVGSGTAFLASELADFAVYTPLRERRWLAAVVASNLVGLLLDSTVFLLLAFGALEWWPGQVLGKLWITGASVIVWGAVRRGWCRS